MWDCSHCSRAPSCERCPRLLLLGKQRRDPTEDGFRGLLVDHEDVAVRAVALAIAAADAIALDVNLSAWIARQCVGRTVEHAQRVLALPAGIRRQQVGELDSRQREPRIPVIMNSSARAAA